MAKSIQYGKKHMVKTDENSKAVQEILEKSPNQRVLAFNREIIALPMYDINDPEDLSERISKYFEITEAYDLKPNIESFAMCLGFNKRHISRIINGTDSGYLRKECRDMISQISNILNANLVQLTMENSVNPVTSIFLLKNNYGYQDKTEVTTSVATERQTADDILKKYNCID